MTTAPKNKEYFYNIDVLRIVFVLFIVYYQFIRANYVAVYNLDIFTRLAHNARYIGEVCNSALFMISGYFLCSTMIRNDESFFHFAARRLMRFWPVLFFGVCCTGILSLCGKMHFDVGSNLLNILCLTRVGSGVVTKFANLTPSWFVCALFWGALFYCAEFCKTLPRPTDNKKSILLTVLEAGILGYLTYILFSSYKVKNIVAIIFLMAILTILFYARKGYVSSWLNKKPFTAISVYVLPIFMTHALWYYPTPIFNYFNKLLGNLAAITAFGILASWITGIVGYHCIQVPCKKYLTKRLNCKK